MFSILIWFQIMIFPEGTCTNRSCLITFKPGMCFSLPLSTCLSLFLHIDSNVTSFCLMHIVFSVDLKLCVFDSVRECVCFLSLGLLWTVTVYLAVRSTDCLPLPVCTVWSCYVLLILSHSWFYCASFTLLILPFSAQIPHSCFSRQPVTFCCSRYPFILVVSLHHETSVLEVWLQPHKCPSRGKSASLVDGKYSFIPDMI